MLLVEFTIAILSVMLFIGKLAKGVDPDQTAPKEQSDLGLHCLL